MALVLVGFGACAISALPQGYVQNDSEMRSYAAAVTGGQLPVRRGVALTADDRLRRDVIERLMCDMAVDIAAVVQQHGMLATTLDDAIEDLAPLTADGLVRIEGRHVEMTDQGRPFVRVAVAAFDAYLETSQGRHAVAV